MSVWKAKGGSGDLCRWTLAASAWTASPHNVHEATLFLPERNLRNRLAALGQRCSNGWLSEK